MIPQRIGFEVLDAQDGHFSLSQARAAGVSPSSLTDGVKRGRLTRPYPGTYRLAYWPPTDHEQLAALQVWSGDRSVASHESALSLWDLSDAMPSRIHVTIPGFGTRRHAPEGVLVYRDSLSAADVDWIGSVRVTTPRRTILDVAAKQGDPRFVLDAIDQAIRRRLISLEDVLPAALYVAAAAGVTL